MTIKSDRWIQRMAQMIFFESDETCAVSYRDRDGKYQLLALSESGFDIPPGRAATG